MRTTLPKGQGKAQIVSNVHVPKPELTGSPELVAEPREHPQRLQRTYGFRVEHRGSEAERPLI